MSDNSRPIRICGVPMDLGQSRRGVDMGPSAIRYAGLQKRLEGLGYTVHDSGNIAVPVNEEIPEGETIDGYPAHHASAIARVSQAVYNNVRACVEADEYAILLGGDHSIALGSVAGALHYAEPSKVGVVWVDAHGDFNTPQTSPSGNVHGMVVSSLMGFGPDMFAIGEQCLPRENLVMVGTRDLDPDEKSALRSQNIHVKTMRDIDEYGIAYVMRSALDILSSVSAIHVSFDLDSLDPLVAPGVGTPVPGGLSYREAHLIMEMLADDGRVCSMDIVEVNPILDTMNRTAEFAVGVAASLFGQRII
jgi:arginase